jgi:hypothetical protein
VASFVASLKRLGGETSFSGTDGVPYAARLAAINSSASATCELCLRKISANFVEDYFHASLIIVFPPQVIPANLGKAAVASEATRFLFLSGVDGMTMA